MFFEPNRSEPTDTPHLPPPPREGENEALSIASLRSILRSAHKTLEEFIGVKVMVMVMVMVMSVLSDRIAPMCRSAPFGSARLPLSFSASDERRYQQANARLVSEEASVKERSARSQRNHRCCHCQSLFSLFHSVSFTQCLSAQSLCPPIGLSLCFAHRAIIEYHICNI